MYYFYGFEYIILCFGIMFFNYKKTIKKIIYFEKYHNMLRIYTINHNILPHNIPYHIVFFCYIILNEIYCIETYYKHKIQKDIIVMTYNHENVIFLYVYTIIYTVNYKKFFLYLYNINTMKFFLIYFILWLKKSLLIFLYWI